MFRKLSELLENNDITKEIADTIDAEISTAMKGLKDDRESLQKRVNELSSSYDEVTKSKESLDTQLANIDERIKQAKKDGQTELTQQLEAERSEKKTLQDNLESLKRANAKLTLDSAVSKELNKFDIKNEDKELVEFRLRAEVKLDDNGSPVYSDGTPIDQAFTSYFEQNKNRLNPAGDASGSGTNNSGGGGVRTISRSDFEKLAPAKKAEAARTMKIT